MAELVCSRPALREAALLAMAAVGRGGQGDVGQRIRDEILTVQSRNDAKVEPLFLGVGRGGQGCVVQRIRDEIRTVQSRNAAKVEPLFLGGSGSQDRCTMRCGR